MKSARGAIAILAAATTLEICLDRLFIRAIAHELLHTKHHKECNIEFRIVVRLLLSIALHDLLHYCGRNNPGRNYIRPPPSPPVLGRRHFSEGGGGGGVYFGAPLGRIFIRPPSFIRPPPLGGYSQEWGGGGV